MAVRENRVAVSASLMAVLRWMMLHASIGLRSGWPGRSGLRSTSVEEPWSGDGEDGGVVPLACDPRGVSQLFGPLRALTKRWRAG